MSTTTDDIRALVETGKRLIAGERAQDPEPDDYIRRFNRRHLTPHARLRQLYAEKQRAEAAVRANDQRITDAQIEVQLMQRQYEGAIEDLSAGKGLPDAAQLDALTLMKGRAVELHALMFRWQARVEGYRLKVEDAGREFDGAYGGWIRAVWARYGPSVGREFQADWGMVERDTDASGWKQPDPPTRAQLDAILAQLEG